MEPLDVLEKVLAFDERQIETDMNLLEDEE